MQRDYLDMLCDVGDLAVLLAGSENVETFFTRLVEVVGRHLDAQVCSIYLYEDATRDLVLRATRGLNPAKVGQLRLSLQEGLVGMALRELRPIVERQASRNPQFKRIEEMDDERFDAFLAMPIQRGIERIGVIVVQRDRREPFERVDVQALRATAAQLAGAIENARVLMSLRQPAPDTAAAPPLPDLVQGLSAVSGMAHAAAVVVDRHPAQWLFDDAAHEKRYTPEAFETALARTQREVDDLQTQLGDQLPEMGSLIFSAHSLMLHDEGFTGEMRRRVTGGENPPDAILAVTRRFVKIFQASGNAYIREKVRDVEDLAARLLGNLVCPDAVTIHNASGRIVVASDLYPSDIVELAGSHAAGLVLVGGGATAHITILARSLNIPTVIVDYRPLLRMPEGTMLLLDGDSGSLYLNPTADVVARFQRRAAERARETAVAEPGAAACLRGGERVHLFTTINLLGDVQLAREAQAEGVGLYRTEFSFLVRSDFPTEEQQFILYDRLVRELPDQRVTFRTLDIGGDKLLAYFEDVGHEANPFLGMRSIRVSLRHPDIFREQLRAILRASKDAADARIMFPMISSVDEFLRAREIVEGCAESLQAEGYGDMRRPRLGVMIEIPSVLEVLDELTPLADFLCIGTNDFIQYMLAVDRTNEKVAAYFLPHHPAVLRGIARVVEAGRRHGREVSVCGEMGHMPLYLPFLVGLGIRHISMDPHYLHAGRRQLALWSGPETQAYAAALLACGRVDEIAQRLRAEP